MTVTVFQLPQRFQLLNGLSSVDAGIRLVPFGVAIPIGAMLGSKIAGAFKVPIIYMIVASSIIQVVGFALLSTLPVSREIPASAYGYQILAGVGCGSVYQSLYLLIPLVAGRLHHGELSTPSSLQCGISNCSAVGMGAATQFRMMGGAVFLAVATSIFNDYVLPRLAELGILDTDARINEAGASAQMIEENSEIREVFAEGYRRQMLVLCAVSAAQVPAALLLWKKKQVVLPSTGKT